MRGLNEQCGFERLLELNDRRAAEGIFSTANEWSPMQWGCAAAGEMGELCNLVKKLERGHKADVENLPYLISRIGEEAADVVIYLDLLIKRINVYVEDTPDAKLNFHNCVRDKFNLTSRKIGSEVYW